MAGVGNDVMERRVRHRQPKGRQQLGPPVHHGADPRPDRRAQLSDIDDENSRRNVQNVRVRSQEEDPSVTLLPVQEFALGTKPIAQVVGPFR